MMTDKVLVILYVPLIEKKYEVFLPISHRVDEILVLVSKAVKEISNDNYTFRNDERLYNRITGQEYKFTDLIKNTNIRNGSQLVFI